VESGLEVVFPNETDVSESETSVSVSESVAAEPGHDIAVVSEGNSATMLSAVSTSSEDHNALIRLDANGPIQEYTSFTLSNPPRIVYDLENLQSPYATEQTIVVDGPWINRIRYYSHPEKVRLVVETSSEQISAHRASVTQNGLAIEISNDVRANVSSAPRYLAAADQVSDADVSQSETAMPGWVDRIDFTSEPDGQSTVIIGSTEIPEYTLEKSADTQLTITLFNTRLPDYRERHLDTTGFESAVDRVLPYTDAGATDQTFFTIEMRESVPYYVEQKGNLLMVHFEASSVPAKAPAKQLTVSEKTVVYETPATSKKPVSKTEAVEAVEESGSMYDEETVAEKAHLYTGEKISLDFYETDIKNVFRILRQVSGLNFAIDKDVSGKVTLSFDEPVPWDQVLDLILKMNQLGKAREGNIIRIATLDTFAREESERQAALVAEQKSKEQELALEPLRTEYIAVNYSNAKSEVLPHIENILSDGRGIADVDERSNLIVITDTNEVIRQAKAIVQRLDRVTPQVMIEARIVEINSDVSNELGISWGLGQDPVVSNELGGSYNWDLAMNFPSSSVSGIGIEFARVAGTPFIIDAQLNAIETQSKGKIISSPKILTLDNKTASITQGLEVGYYERDDTGGSATAFKSIDLVLEVTPHVTPDDRVSMIVNIEKNDLAGEFNDAPLITSNQAETEFLVNDGETIVIGGILKKTETTLNEGFPILKDIPGLKWLFSEKNEQEINQELLIFITPKIVTLSQRAVE
jgi:type IV pilus assembly protein PilQ